MLSLFDRNSDQAELHGIVTIQPHRAFHSVMTKLNNTLLKGHPIEVRRFYKRSPLNDRRLNRHIKIDDNAQNRRLADRRRKHLEIYKCYS